MASWQNIIWREWRHCNDIEYEARLFAAVADEPVGWGSRICLTLLNALTGATVTLSVAFLFTLNGTIIQQLLLAGGAIGAANGYLAGRELTWRDWLARLQANTPTESFGRLLFSVLVLALVGGMFFGPLAWLAMVGFFWGMGGIIHWINSSTNESETYRSGDREWWFWWWKRPHFLEVKTALHQACNRSEAVRAIWAQPLHRLETEHLQRSPDTLARLWLSSDWVERLIASYRLMLFGEQVVPLLKQVAREEPLPLQKNARWLLKNIAKTP